MTQADMECCERLAWDSDFFGIEIGRVRTNHLSPAILETTERWCLSNAIECLYFLGESNDAPTIRLAESFGFELVDIRVTLNRRISPDEEYPAVPRGLTIRPSVPADLEHLSAIARSSYGDSRFYFDSRFPAGKSDRFYEIWLEKSFADDSGVVLVAEWQGTPAGYVTCDRVDAATGQIGLLGVGSSAQGVGLGKALVSAAVDWFRQQGFDDARVVTQGRNIPAQVVYQHGGFVSQSMQLWYHRWFERGALRSTVDDGPIGRS